MLLPALRTIGETIGDEEFTDPYERYWTPGDMADTQAVVVVQLTERGAADGDEDETPVYDHTGTRLRSAGDPVDMARTYGYAYNHIRDQSLTQRIAGSPEKNIKYMMQWVDQDEIGDVRDAPIVRALRDVFDRQGDEIRKDACAYFDTDDDGDDDTDGEQDEQDERETLTPSSAEPVFVTVELVDADGTAHWPGEIDAIREGVRNFRRVKLANASAGSGNEGEAVCAVCDERTTVYGGGASLDRVYSLKKQGSFTGYNASDAWRNRPLCIECIDAIETAWERFVDPQQYGPPGVKAKVIPYATSAPGADEQLRDLIRRSRDDIIGTESYDDEPDRPLARAWDGYRKAVDDGRTEGALRLAILFYSKEQSRAHTLAWIDGVSQHLVSRVEETAEAVVERPAYVAGLRPGGPPEETGIRVAPTERQIWTGMWAYDLLARESSRSGDDPEPSDDQIWIEVTAALLTGGSIPWETVISAVGAELRARIRRDREQGIEHESEIEDPYYAPPFDAIHVARAYVLLETLAELDVIDHRERRGSGGGIDRQPNHGHGDTDMSTDDTADRQQQYRDMDETYDSLGAAVEDYIERNPPIADSPGRTAAFAIGVMASALSAWQQNRGLNRTYLQTVDLDSVDIDRLPRMRSQIWEKAQTYNAQMGNYGTPWSDLHTIVDEAILAGERDGWGVSRDDVHTYFIMGSVAGARLNARVEREDDEAGIEAETAEQAAEQADD